MKKYSLLGLFFCLLWGSFALNGADVPRPFTDISPEQAMEMIHPEQGASLVRVLDVRTPAEFAEGNIIGALSLNVNASDFAERVAKLDKKESYIVYCRSGKRSARAMAKMKELGFERVFNLSGGMLRWLSEKRPVEGRMKEPSQG